MKWAGLILVFAAIAPLASWLRRNPREAPKIWILVGFLPFAISPFHLLAAPISWVGWSGYVQGIEFTVLDGIVIAIYLSLPRSPFPLPFRISMYLYFAAVVLSVFQAGAWMQALFYPWQLARMFLLYATVVRASRDERVIPAILTGLAVGICMETAFAVWERFAQGIIQTGGTFGHQNFLGMVSHFVIFPFFALLLTSRSGWLPAIVSLSGAFITALTASRATVGLNAFGYLAVFALSLSKLGANFSRKIIIGFAGLAALVVLVPLAVSSLEDRFAKDQQYASDERSALNDAAAMILSDHPMGIGPNNYVVIANVDGYYDRAGVAWSSASAIVHNVYWLVADKSGYLGLVTFLLLLIRPLAVAFGCGWRNRSDYRGNLLLGFGVSLLTVYIHSFFEWAFLLFQTQYMFALTVGAVAGLAQQLGYWRRAPVYGMPMGASLSDDGRLPPAQAKPQATSLRARSKSA